jgi:uncharacterized protein (TIGR02996 family)
MKYSRTRKAGDRGSRMSLEQGFIRAIVENPDDDAHRLIFADWLEEHGGAAGAARAEFIRIQCERARPGGDQLRRNHTWAREQELLLAHEADWVAPLRPWVREWQFGRGFVERVRIPAEYVLGQGRQVFEQTPVRHARFNEATRHIAELVKMPELSRLGSLDLGYNSLTEETIRPLAKTLYLAQLNSLNLANNAHLRNAGAVTLARASLPGLWELYLYGTGLGPAGLAALLRARDWPGFTVLDLHSNPLLAAGATTLARSPRVAALVRLDLSSTQGNDRGARALADSPFLGHLKQLGLNYYRMTDAGAEALAAARSLHGLEELDLSGNDIGDAGAIVLAESKAFTRLRRLNLGANPIAGETAQRRLRERFGDGVILPGRPA